MVLTVQIFVFNQTSALYLGSRVSLADGPGSLDEDRLILKIALEVVLHEYNDVDLYETFAQLSSFRHIII